MVIINFLPVKLTFALWKVHLMPLSFLFKHLAGKFCLVMEEEIRGNTAFVRCVIKMAEWWHVNCIICRGEVGVSHKVSSKR